MEMNGKVAFVTGGSGDIGAAIAKVLARTGVDVAVSYVGNLDGAVATAAVVEAAGRRCVKVLLDQRDPESIDRAVAQVVESLGRLDILVNNAGWNIGIPFSASKAGLIHLTRCLAVAIAPSVTVNCVAPGLVEGTRVSKRLPEAIAEGARRQAVLGRTASVDDIADQVLTFCRAESVTGQVMVVDGGMPVGMR